MNYSKNSFKKSPNFTSKRKNQAPSPTNYKEVKNDPIKAYIKDCGRYPLISKEDLDSAFFRYRDSGDEDAKNLIVVSNLRLVTVIAFKYRGYTFSSPIDLIQEGNLGLIRAVEKYDPKRGVKFSRYASYWIKAFILKHIMDNWGLVRAFTSTPRRALFARLKKKKDDLIARGIEPSTENISKSLGFKEEDVLSMEMMLENPCVSLNQPVSKNNDTEMIDCIPSNTDPEYLVIRKDLRERGLAILESFRDELTERELTIFDNRMRSNEPLTLQELGQRLGLTREGVRQSESRVYEKLYRHIETESSKLPEPASRDEDLPDVSVSEVTAVTKSNNRTQEIVLLYFGLNDEGCILDIEEIASQTGCPKERVRPTINKVKRRIKRLREREGAVISETSINEMEVCT